MRFWVKVPVLSVKMTLVPPNVSTADNRLTITFFSASRSIPYASAMVATTDIPSGMAAMARARAVSISRSGSSFRIRPTTRNKAASATVTQISTFDSESSFASSGVADRLASFTIVAILPSSVCCPMPVTMARPLPAVTGVPLNRRLCWSPRGDSSGGISVFLSTGNDSPVSADSSICNWLISNKLPSAATRSPASTTRISPRVTSSDEISRMWPSRSTLAGVVSIFRRASIDCRAFHSSIKPVTALTSKTAMMAKPSTVSPRKNEIPAAAARM